MENVFREREIMAKLTSDQMIDIMVDGASGRKLQSRQAKEFRKGYQAFAKEVEAKGGVVDIPYEIPQPDKPKGSK